MNLKMNQENLNKPIYKKWWFWLIVVFLIGAIGSIFEDEDVAEEVNLDTEEAVEVDKEINEDD